MVNEHRLSYMIRLARQSSGKNKKMLRIANYYRNDYIALALIRRFIIMTIAFVLLVGLTSALMLEYIISNITTLDYKMLGGQIIIAYVIFIGIYLGITYVTYSVRYMRAKRVEKEYHDTIKRIDRMYVKEEAERESEDQ